MTFLKNNIFMKLIRNEIEIKPLSVFELLAIAFLFFGIQFTILFPIFLLLELLGLVDNYILTSLFSTLSIAITLWIALKILSRKTETINSYPRNFKITKRKVLLGIGLGVSYVLISSATIHNLINLMPMPTNIEMAFDELLNQNILFILFSIVIEAAILEEFICRGLVLNGLLNKYSPRTAIIISAVAFGVMHANIPQFINATILGLFLGLIYYKTKSLVLCIIVHAANNAFVFLIPELTNIYIIIPLYIIYLVAGIIIFKRFFNGLGLKQGLKELFTKKEKIA